MLRIRNQGARLEYWTFDGGWSCRPFNVIGNDFIIVTLP